MSNWSKAAMAVAALALPASALAQSFDPATHPFAGERRVSVGLSLPLGGAGREADKPQLELRTSAAAMPGARDRAIHGDGFLARRNRDSRVGLTLEANPRLTLAGRELAAPEERLGISTLGLVAIGVGAAAIVGGLLFIDAVRDNSD